MSNPFERVVCVSLARRQDRWDRFISDIPSDWPFGEIERFNAFDGKKCKPPSWWKMGGGAWGCYRSHLSILEDSLNRGIESVLFLEDDALCGEDFTARWERFHASLPGDWGMIYLGGQHLYLKRKPPKGINSEVVRPYNVNRTHAFGLRGGMLRTVYRHLNETRGWQNRHHIDHHLGRLHQTQQHPVYCPSEWLIGQNETTSNINGQNPPTRFWNEENPESPMLKNLFVAILGLHRSGSSCMAGVCAKLGVHMGNKFIGCENDGGYEAEGFAQMCEQTMPYPGIRVRQNGQTFAKKFPTWAQTRDREASGLNTMAGCKYPHLCTLIPHVEEFCGANLRVIHINRPLEASIQSLIRRDGRRRSHDKLRNVQRKLWNDKNNFLRSTGAEVLTVKYADLLNNTRREVERVGEFLSPLDPSTEQVEQAIAYVNPELCHIKPSEPVTV